METDEKYIDKAALNAQWDEMMKGVFQSFIESTVGLDANYKPTCFGTGASGSYCEYCRYRDEC